MIAERLEYLRGELRAERLSYGELAELQGLADQIDPGDVELLEAAGVPEFPVVSIGSEIVAKYSDRFYNGSDEHPGTDEDIDHLTTAAAWLWAPDLPSDDGSLRYWQGQVELIGDSCGLTADSREDTIPAILREKIAIITAGGRLE